MSSTEISDVSMNSSSKIFFTTLASSVAAGLNGPGCRRPGAVGLDFWIPSEGCAVTAAEARRSRPCSGVWEGVNVGRFTRSAGLSFPDSPPAGVR